MSALRLLKYSCVQATIFCEIMEYRTGLPACYVSGPLLLQVEIEMV